MLKGEKRIYPTKEKLSLISECGIDEVIIASFEEVRSISAEDFIEKTLVADLGCALALSERISDSVRKRRVRLRF